MPESCIFCHESDSPDKTTQLAAALAPILSAGDVLLLDGGIGAGKTHFARSLIRNLQGPDSFEDIPSPTFTLVQIYETHHCTIWHADLYRLTSADEISELGLEDAFDTALCLVEWPDRLAGGVPSGALVLRFQVGVDESRKIELRGDAIWKKRLSGIAAAMKTRQ